MASSDQRNAARRVAAKQRERAHKSALATHLTDLKALLHQSKVTTKRAVFPGPEFLSSKTIMRRRVNWRTICAQLV